MLNSFINDFKKSEFFNLLFEEIGSDVMCIFVGGSHLANVADESSDFDIICFVEGSNIYKCSDYYLDYKNTSAHWVWTSLDRYYSDSVNIFEYCGQYQIKNLTKDKLLYVNDKYKNEVDNLLSDVENISKAGQLRLVRYLEKYINEICEDNYIKQTKYSKKLYHLSLVFYYLNNIEVDHEYIKELKRIKWRPVRQEYLDRTFNIIRWLKNNVLDQ